MYTKKHYVFDLDDTITDSYDFNQQIFVDALAPYLMVKNLQVDSYLRQLHFQSRGTSMRSQFEEALNHFKVNMDVDQILYENEQLQAKKIDQMKIFDAVEEIIRDLKTKGKQISIFSNRDKATLMGILKHNNLTECFTNIISCVEAGHEKPDPYCLKKLIKQSGLTKKDFIYFGDSKTDSQFAQAAGIDYVIVDHYINNKKFYRLMLQAFI